jgi:hypothetical protein
MLVWIYLRRNSISSVKVTVIYFMECFSSEMFHLEFPIQFHFYLCIAEYHCVKNQTWLDWESYKWKFPSDMQCLPLVIDWIKQFLSNNMQNILCCDINLGVCTLNVFFCLLMMFYFLCNYIYVVHTCL